MGLNSKIPAGKLSEKWTDYKGHCKIVSPANKRGIDIIVVGTGLAGSSAAASLAEMGYNVKAFCFQDSPRRAHSIAAQGGINAAKNYKNDGDSVFRLFYDTVTGGDYMEREANGTASALSLLHGNLPKECYKALMKASSATIMKLARDPKYIGSDRLIMTSVLHT